MNIRKISLPVKKKAILSKKYKGASSCVRMEASYMAEFSIALPFFTGFIMVLLFFFQALSVQQEVGNAMLAVARELSVIEYNSREESVADLLAAKMLLTKNIPKSSAADQFIRGGKIGITISGSDFSGNYICLKADYKIRLPFGLFGKREIEITQKIKCRKWSGSSNTDILEETIVFITPKGSVYHKNKTCSYLQPSISSVSKEHVLSLRNAGGGKYYSCTACMKNEKPNNITVYVAKFGNRYHSSRNCSRIKRTVWAVHLSEVKDKRGCSKCGKE